MPISVETAVEPATATIFYDLYLAAIEPLRERAVARQVLNRDEFFAQMTDPRVLKYVAWESDGRAVGLTTLTCHLETVPWISPEYFAAHFPEHIARNALYYLAFTVMHPSQQGGPLFTEMFHAVVQRLSRERAVCAYDICAYNNAAQQLAGSMEALLHRTADVTVERLDTQTYYGVAFTGGPPRPREPVPSQS